MLTPPPYWHLNSRKKVRRDKRCSNEPAARRPPVRAGPWLRLPEPPRLHVGSTAARPSPCSRTAENGKSPSLLYHTPRTPTFPIFLLFITRKERGELGGLCERILANPQSAPLHKPPDPPCAPPARERLEAGRALSFTVRPVLSALLPSNGGERFPQTCVSARSRVPSPTPSPFSPNPPRVSHGIKQLRSSAGPRQNISFLRSIQILRAPFLLLPPK